MTEIREAVIVYESMVKPCARCGKDVTREVPPASQRYAYLMRDTPWHCEECLREINAEAAKIAEDAVLRTARRDSQRRLKRSGLPSIHTALLIKDLDHPQPLRDACRSWAAGDLPGLLLVGPVGTGKTTLAGAAALEMLDVRQVVWTSAPLLFARLGSGFQSEQREWALDVLAGRDALVLDDIDKARPTEYGAEQVFLAVDQRVEHRLPLLVTSNLDPDGIAAHWPTPYGTAIASRLVGYCRVLKVEGDDRRLTKLVRQTSNKGS